MTATRRHITNVLDVHAVPGSTQRFERLTLKATTQAVTLDDHSKVVPLLPIPNRTVKRLRADDSGRTSVKVGHRQALIPQSPAVHGGALSLAIIVRTQAQNEPGNERPIDAARALSITLQAAPMLNVPK